jgi:TRAP-type C4-dicarboxylate transport system substrate-binding protein
MGETLLISKTRVKNFMHEKGVRVSADFYVKLDERIKRMLLDAAERAKGNVRTTILEQDI